MEGAYQCVPVVAGSTYDFVAQLSIPADQGDGSGLVALLYFPTADCSGGPTGAAVSDQVTAVATCEVLTMSASVPAGIGSAAIRLTALKPFPSPAFEVDFDNVLFKKQ
jgi:hypothetical protein